MTTFRQDNHSVRSEHWRYTRYADGGEEFYDERNDPYEWTNLVRAAKANLLPIRDLKKFLPKQNIPAAGGRTNDKE